MTDLTREEALSYVDKFLAHVDASDLAEFLERVVNDELEDAEGK